MTKIQMTGSPLVLTVIDRPGGGHRFNGAPIRKRSIVRDDAESETRNIDRLSGRPITIDRRRFLYRRAPTLSQWVCNSSTPSK